jgi:hypothetical protein
MAHALSRLRHRTERWMADQAVISRASWVDDGAGGRERVLVQVGTSSCRLRRTTYRDLEALSQELRQDATDLAIATFPHDAGVRNEDVITVDGIDYEVVNAGVPGATYQVNQVCTVKRRI